MGIVVRNRKPYYSKGARIRGHVTYRIEKQSITSFPPTNSNSLPLNNYAPPYYVEGVAS